MASEIHDLSRALGGLEAAVEQMRNLWAQQEMQAVEGRRLLHAKMDLMRDEMRAITSTTKENEKTLIEIVPAVNEFKNQRQRQLGAMALGRWLWGIWLAGAGMIGWAIHEFFSWPKPPLPPLH